MNVTALHVEGTDVIDLLTGDDEHLEVLVTLTRQEALALIVDLTAAVAATLPN